jgi:histidinol phosphatase-like enzyme
MNIIFLDIDGVLNSKSGITDIEKFGLDDKLILNLKFKYILKNELLRKFIK